MPPEETPTGAAAPAAAGVPPTPAAAAENMPSAAAPIEPAPAADVPAAAPAKEAAPAPAEPAKPASPEFAPSLLDEAAKPAADAKPSDKPADKPVEGKDGEAKPPADKAPAAEPTPPAPIEYAFTLDNGKGERVAIAADKVDPERMAAFTGILNEARVAPEAAQKMVDLHFGEVNRAVDQARTQQWDVFNNTQNQWRERVMANPEIGGARHETALKSIVGLVDAFGNRFQNTKSPRDAAAIAAERKELMDVFRMTGAANNEHILGLLHFAAEKLREGVARPAPPPRSQAPNAASRGVGRYRNTTPG